MKAAELVLSEEAKQDLRDLLNEESTKPIGIEAMRRLRGLEEEPYQGEKLRYESNRKPLAQADCRKLKFDDPELSGDEPSRYRIVYRLEPFEGAANQVYVLIIAVKRQAYGEGTARAAARLRQVAAERAQRRLRKRGA